MPTYNIPVVCTISQWTFFLKWMMIHIVAHPTIYSSKPLQEFRQLGFDRWIFTRYLWTMARKTKQSNACNVWLYVSTFENKPIVQLLFFSSFNHGEDAGRERLLLIRLAIPPLWNQDLRTVWRMWRSCFSKSSSTVCIWDSRGPENSTFSAWSW